MFNPGDRVIIPQGRFSFAVGTVVDVSPQNITVSVVEKDSGRTVNYRVHPTNVTSVGKTKK